MSVGGGGTFPSNDPNGVFEFALFVTTELPVGAMSGGGMFNGVFGIANGTVFVVGVVEVVVVVDVVVVVAAAGGIVPWDAVGVTVANGSNVPLLVVADAEAAGAGAPFNGLNGSALLALVAAAGGCDPGLLCAPGAGGSDNGAGSTATGVGGAGGGEAMDDPIKMTDMDNATATADRKRLRIKAAPLKA